MLAPQGQDSECDQHPQAGPDWGRRSWGTVWSAAWGWAWQMKCVQGPEVEGRLGFGEPWSLLDLLGQG